MRKENAKSGGDSEMVEFDCFSLCISCGYLAEPTHGDPMRTESVQGVQVCCPSCGQAGLVDLRHTPTVFALNELEEREEEPSFRARAERFLGFFVVAGSVLGAAGLVSHGAGGGLDGLGAAAFVLGPIALATLPLIGSLATRMGSPERSNARRWRLPKLRRPNRVPPRRKRIQAIARTEVDLLTAPLSGRPCLAYEIGVREDDDSDASVDTWRLLEQDNVGFRLGDHYVPRGRAMLRLPRQLSSRGVLMSRDAKVRRFMRMRGFVESEDVYVYETILVPDAACEWVVGRGDDVTQIFA